jgi:predicted Rossmann fold nucleotide-binding protein DprA/Smf involved in DNA uptake
MMNSSELKARLQDGIEELEADIVKLRAAITALDGHDHGDGTTTRRPRQTTRRGRASAAKPAVVPAGKLSELLKASDGLSTAELARRTNGSADQVLQMLKELEQAGTARRSGQRRGTRWHAEATRPARASRRARATRSRGRSRSKTA